MKLSPDPFERRVTRARLRGMLAAAALAAAMLGVISLQTSEPPPPADAGGQPKPQPSAEPGVTVQAAAPSRPDG